MGGIIFKVIGKNGKEPLPNINYNLFDINIK
jgi:hypothetical protein